MINFVDYLVDVYIRVVEHSKFLPHTGAENTSSIKLTADAS